MGYLVYHEKQVAGLCGVHCLNTLLQGAYFTEIDLMTIAQELDRKEREVMAEFGTETSDFLKYMAEDSGNVADDGNYSVQVLSKALEVWGLHCIPISNPEAGDAKTNPTKETAFICHLGNHWFTIRKVGDHWWNFDSLQDSPTFVGDFYLALFLDTLRLKNYSIFVVRGTFPPRQAEDLTTDRGNWVYVEPGGAGGVAQQRRQRTEEEELEEAIRLSLLNSSTPAPATGNAPKPGAITLEHLQAATHPLTAQYATDEEYELAAAIAASLASAPNNNP